jgi:hypothetical protein
MATLIGGTSTHSNSWKTDILFDADVYSFDTFEAFIIADTGAGPFQNDGAFEFSKVSWSASLINPNYSLASGDSFDDWLVWYWDFAGDSNQWLSMDLLFWDGGVGGNLDFAANFDYEFGLIGNVEQGWDSPDGTYAFLQHPDGSGYDRSSRFPDTGNGGGTPIPEPATIFLLAAGIFGLAAWGKRKRQ